MKVTGVRHVISFFGQAALLVCMGVCISACKHPEKHSEADFLPVFEVIKGAEYDFDGYLFLRRTDKPGLQFMLDHTGKVVWYLQTDSAVSREFYPLATSFLCLADERNFFEISYKGDTLIHLSDSDFSFPNALHHEIIKLNDGNYAALTKDVFIYDYSRLGFEKTDSLKTDGIVVFDGSGQALWRWSFKSVLDTLRADTLDFFQLRNDWVHANSLSVDDDGNFLISFRDLNEVWKISRLNGQIVFRYGGQGKQGLPGKFKAQHMFYRLNSDSYIVFNNGPGRDSITSSSAVRFRYIPESHALVNTGVIRLPDSVFTLKEGSVVQIDPDKFLFSVSRTKDLIVTDSRGKVHWWAKSNVGFYRAYFLEKSVLKDKGFFSWLPF